MTDQHLVWKHKDSLFSAYVDNSSNGDFSVETVMEKKPDGTIVIVSVNILPKSDNPRLQSSCQGLE